jgi:hypothetical protein
VAVIAEAATGAGPDSWHGPGLARLIRSLPSRFRLLRKDPHETPRLISYNQIFGTGKDASIRNTYEWTYTNGTSKLSRSPAGWCIPGTTTCARFFGGVTRSSPRALIWQWSGGGGITNGIGDFDQINAAGR